MISVPSPTQLAFNFSAMPACNCSRCGKVILGRRPHVIKERNYCSKACWYASGAPRPGQVKGQYWACLVCGKSFYCRRTAKRPCLFCSLKCKGISSRTPEKPCSVCGTSFRPRLGRPNAPCCSRPCGYIYRTHGIEKPCEECGTAFYVAVGRAPIARFCGKTCATTWQGRNKTKHTCKMCGKAFRWSPSRTASGKYNVTYCSQRCFHSDPDQQARILDMVAKQQLLKGTKPEKIGYAILDGLGVPYLPQHVIGNKFCVDAFVPSAALVVQFDGNYWHGHPTRFPDPDTRQRRRMRLDRSQDAYMAKCGYRVARIWEVDLLKHPEHVRTRLRQCLGLQEGPS